MFADVCGGAATEARSEHPAEGEKCASRQEGLLTQSFVTFLLDQSLTGFAHLGCWQAGHWNFAADKQYHSPTSRCRRCLTSYRLELGHSSLQMFAVFMNIHVNIWLSI